MLKLARIRVMDRGDFETYMIQFAIDDDDPDFLSTEVVLGEGQTLDNLVATARKEVLARLNAVVAQG